MPLIPFCAAVPMVFTTQDLLRQQGICETSSIIHCLTVEVLFQSFMHTLQGSFRHLLLVGKANNHANRRYFNGMIDEINFYQTTRRELIKKEIIIPNRCMYLCFTYGVQLSVTRLNIALSCTALPIFQAR